MKGILDVNLLRTFWEKLIFSVIVQSTVRDCMVCGGHTLNNRVNVQANST